LLLNKNVHIQRSDSLEDTQTMVKLFHYIYAKGEEQKELQRRSALYARKVETKLLHSDYNELKNEAGKTELSPNEYIQFHI